MQVAQTLNPIILPQLPRLAAYLTSMDRFQFGGKDTLANGVICMIHVDAQSAS
jgi:hypothetical protein